MAIYNEILEGRYSRGLQKLFGIKGTVPTRQLSGELMAVFALPQLVDSRSLEGWYPFAARAETNAVAAQDSVIRLSNTSKNNIAIVSQFYMSANVATFVFFEHDHVGAPVILSNLGSQVNLDGRFKSPQTGTDGSGLVVSWQNNIGQKGVAFGGVNLGAQAPSVFTMFHALDYIPILPGSEVSLRTSAVNVDFAAAFRWSERSLGDAEVSII